MKQESRPGRPGLVFGLALEFDRASFAGVFDTAEPRVVYTRTKQINSNDSPVVQVHELVEMIREGIGELGVPKYVYCAVPFPFDRNQGGAVLSAPGFGPQWPGHPIGARLSQCVNRPVALVKDGLSDLVAATLMGGAKAMQDVISVSLRPQRISSGVLVGGVYPDGVHDGEIGHIGRVTGDGRLCPCGAHGCLHKMVETVRDDAGYESLGAVADAASGGEERAQAVIRGIAEHLSSWIAQSAGNRLPQIVVLESEAGVMLRRKVRAALIRTLGNERMRDIDVADAGLPDDLREARTAIGAALVPLALRRRQRPTFV